MYDPNLTCEWCLKGEHVVCPDFMWEEEVGIFSCACEDTYHRQGYDEPEAESSGLVQ